jgi:acetyl-CoA carboxylase carboxyltransferase component
MSVDESSTLLADIVPANERQVFDMRRFIRGLVDEGSFFEIHALWAREVTVGFGRRQLAPGRVGVHTLGSGPGFGVIERGFGTCLPLL